MGGCPEIPEAIIAFLRTFLYQFERPFKVPLSNEHVKIVRSILQPIGFQQFSLAKAIIQNYHIYISLYLLMGGINSRFGSCVDKNRTSLEKKQQFV